MLLPPSLVELPLTELTECHLNWLAVVESTIAQLSALVSSATTGVYARALARLHVGKFDGARLALRHDKRLRVDVYGREKL